MKKRTRRFLKFTIFTTAAVGILHFINKYIENNSYLNSLDDFENYEIYSWRHGDISYKVKGDGKPLLLVHDLIPGSGSFEWDKIIDALSEQYKVYAIDLLGFANSDKVGITYTNFLYVQLITDFIEDVIQEKTSVIANGFSSSIISMANLYKQELIDKLVFVNPDSPTKLSDVPGFLDGFYKNIIKIPVLGTFIYNLNVSRETFRNMCYERLFHDPFNVTENLLDKFYESAHIDTYNAKFFYASFKSKFINANIEESIVNLNNPVLIISGEYESNRTTIVEEYLALNPDINTNTIEDSRHYPHMECSEHFTEVLLTWLA